MNNNLALYIILITFILFSCQTENQKIEEFIYNDLNERASINDTQIKIDTIKILTKELVDEHYIDQKSIKNLRSIIKLLRQNLDLINRINELDGYEIKSYLNKIDSTKREITESQNKISDIIIDASERKYKRNFLNVKYKLNGNIKLKTINDTLEILFYNKFKNAIHYEYIFNN